MHATLNMVLSDNKENNKEMMDGDENKKKNETMPKKLFSCAELERSIGLRRDGKLLQV